MPLLVSHLDDHGELLGHVLMGDMWRWACQELDKAPNDVRRFLEVLSHHLGSDDDDVSNIICVSFLEYLIGVDPAKSHEYRLRAALPPRLAAELARMESWRAT